VDRQKKYLKKTDAKKGAALLWVVIFVGISSFLVTNLFLLVLGETRIGVNSDLSYKAYVAAQSGIEATMARLKDDINKNGVLYFNEDASKQLPYQSISHQLSTDGVDVASFNASVTFQYYPLDILKVNKPTITVVSTGLVIRGEKTSRRRLVHKSDYNANVGFETFEGPEPYYGSVMGVLRGAFRATVLIEVVNGRPELDMTFLPQVSGLNPNETRLEVKRWNGLSHLNPFVEGKKIYYPETLPDKMRWRFDYLGGSGVYASLEKRVVNNTNGSTYWECVRGHNFNNLNLGSYSDLNSYKLLNPTGWVGAEKEPIFARSNWERDSLEGATWKRFPEPNTNGTNHVYAPNAGPDNSIDNVVAIRY
jgi:hypothetical protein